MPNIVKPARCRPMTIPRRQVMIFALPFIGAALAAGILVAARRNAHRQLDITEIEMPLPRLDPAFTGFRLIQISDIHMNQMKPERLEQIVEQVNALCPDLIVITGDYVTHDPENYTASLAAALQRLHAPGGVYTVLGNHDHWAGVDEVRRMLTLAGITELRNDLITLQRQDALLHIAGVDTTYLELDRLDEVLARLPQAGPAILLAHEPDYADTSAAAGRFALQLSGHSHGGQAHLPLIGSPFLPPHARKYPRGLYEINGMYLYTNRGLGTMYFNGRINAPPEITVFILCPAPVSTAGAYE